MMPNKVSAVREVIVVSLIDTTLGVLQLSKKWHFSDELS